MNESVVSEKELRIIEEIARERSLTQRDLSQRAGISLGMVNMSLKKLIKKGHVKVRGMNKRSLEYVLTPKGFSEKAQCSYRYFRSTLDSLRVMKKKIQQAVLIEYAQGACRFAIYGEGELADIVELSLKDLPLDELEYVRLSSARGVVPGDEIVLYAGEGGQKMSGAKRWIDVTKVLAE